MEAKRSKTPMYCQENHKFKKDVVRNFPEFKWASRSSALSIWSYSHWPILQEFCTEESERCCIEVNVTLYKCQVPSGPLIKSYIVVFTRAHNK